MKKLLTLLSLVLFNNILFSQTIRLQEDFNLSNLPNGWTTSALSGSQTWGFGIDGSTTNSGINNIDSTAMAFFDDDNLGASNSNNTVSLTTPLFDNSADPISILQFDYNFREFGGISLTDSFYVEVYDGANWVNIFSTKSDDCGNWLGLCAGNFPNAAINISAHKNQICQIRFTYHDGNDWCWYVGIDNVKVISQTLINDIGIAEIISPNTDCDLSTAEIIQVKIKNFGDTAVMPPFNAICDINNGSQLYTETILNSIPVGDSLIYNFVTTSNFSVLGNYSLRAYTDYSKDSISTNDTSLKLVENRRLFTIPFTDNFEGTNNWTSNGLSSSWSLGVPNATFINSAVSDSNAFVTNLIGNSNNEKSYLISPCFDFSQSSTIPIVNFNLFFHTQSRTFDTLNFQSSIDGGQTWQIVPTSSEALNWYNSGQVWVGQSSKWIRTENQLQQLIGQSNVRFRFFYKSGYYLNREGVGVDNFSIRFKQSYDLSIGNIRTDEILACGINSSKLILPLINFGSNPIDTCYVNYQINNSIILIDTVIQNIPVDSFIIINSNKKLPFLSTSNNLINVWVNAPKDSVKLNDSTINFELINPLSRHEGNLYTETCESFVDFGCNGLNYLDETKSWLTTSSGSFKWLVHDVGQCGGAPRSNTGPNFDHTFGNGTFIYTYSHIGNYGDAKIESPCINFTYDTTAELSFWYHKYGIGITNLYIDVFSNGTWHNGIDTVVGQTQFSSNDPWLKKIVNLNSFAGQIITVRFKAPSPTPSNLNSRSDIAIDDIQFYSPTSRDISLDEVLSPKSDCFLSSTETVSIKLTNYGRQDLLPGLAAINYQLNKGVVVSELIQDTIKVDSNINFSFNQTVDLSAYTTTNELLIFSTFIPDKKLSNDTLRYQIYNNTQTVLYSEGFENINDSSCVTFSSLNQFLPIGWIDQSVNPSRWYVQNATTCYGDSTTGATISIGTGPANANTGNSFIYFEASNSTNFTAENIMMPCFDLNGNSRLNLDFYYHKFGAGMGDLLVEIDTNQSGSWITIDSILGQTHLSSFDPWSLRSISLDSFVNKNIRLRFTVRAGLNFNYESDIALDDIRIYNPLMTSIEKIKPKFNFTIYPNPNNGNFNLKVSNKLIGKQYQVFDLTGSVIKQSKIDTPLSQIELNNVKNGIYFIKIEGLSKAERIIVI